ncbi:MAG: hypothetical protein HY787_09525 [Deltaproteobacteria bacterium]|nr:hypothetical protein [Deltaproteobacteria bacterium]
MSYFRFICLALGSVFFLFGCFQTETVIRLKPDGSGVIEETLLLSKDLLESFQELAKGFDDEADKTRSEAEKEKQDPIQGMIRDARSKESQYGTGVKFISATPLRTETMGGYKATYAFKDINTLKVNQNPGKMTEKSGGGGQIPAKEENILFKFIKGPVSTLTVTMPKNKEEKKASVQKKEPPDKGPADPDPKAMEQVKTFLKDMGIKIALEIEGNIIKTNATYRKKSEITIVELHFGKLIENKDVFEKVVTAQPKTVEEAKELVKGIEGLKIETANPLVVEFK